MAACRLLSAAAHRGDLREVRRYVQQHEPFLVDAVEKGGSRWTPLMHASRGGHVSVATYLLDHGARVDFRDREGDTALHVAASRDHRKLVELLLERGADPTIRGRNQSAPLSLAAGSEIVRLLLVHGKCEVDLADCWGKTALWWSCYYGRMEVTRHLIGAGADPTLADHQGRSPLTIVTETPHESCRTFLEEWERAYVLTKARRLRDAYTSIATCDGSQDITADDRRRLEGDLAGVELGECLRRRVCESDAHTHTLPRVELVKEALLLDVDYEELDGGVRGGGGGGGAAAEVDREEGGQGEEEEGYDGTHQLHHNHHHRSAPATGHGLRHPIHPPPSIDVDPQHQQYGSAHVCNDGRSDTPLSRDDDATVVGCHQDCHGTHDAVTPRNMTPASSGSISSNGVYYPHHHNPHHHHGFDDDDDAQDAHDAHDDDHGSDIALDDDDHGAFFDGGDDSDSVIIGDADGCGVGGGGCHDDEWRVWVSMVADHVLGPLKGELFADVMVLMADD